MPALLAVSASVAAARGWTAPVAVVAPAPLQIVGPHVAFSAAGQAAVAFAFVDTDRPARAQAWVALVSPSGRPALARRIPGAREALDVAFLNGAFQVLVGADGGARCCASARELTLGARGPGRQRTLARGVGGFVLGALVGAGRGMLAALADPGQVRVAQARSGARFGSARRLTPAGTSPRSLVAGPLAGAHTLLAWIAGGFVPVDNPAPESIMVATGTASSVPGPPRALVTLAAGHSASQLALADGTRPTLAWIEDFTDENSAYRSEVAASTLGSSAAPITFTQDGTVQSGLSAAADAAGDQVLAWSACDSAPTCQVMAVSRSPRGSFGRPVALGTIDAGAQPAVALASGGAAALGWISDGRVVIAGRGSAGARFGPGRRLPGSGYAGDLRLAAGPGGRLLAAWSDGSPRRVLDVSLYSPR